MSSTFRRRGPARGGPLAPTTPPFHHRSAHAPASQTNIPTDRHDGIVEDNAPPPSPAPRPLQSPRTTHGFTTLPGTKPWTGGISLTSTGLREIDAILGGGQPLGTSILIEEDRWTDDVSCSLCRYWCAEAVAHRQSLLLPYIKARQPLALPGCPFSLGNCADVDRKESFRGTMGLSPDDLHSFVDSLPRNLHLDKARSTMDDEGAVNENAGEADGVALTASFAIIEEECRDHHPDEEPIRTEAAPHGDEGLKNAWQYRTDVQSKRLGVAANQPNPFANPRHGKEPYCHSYDLFSHAAEQHPPGFLRSDESGISVVDCVCPICPSERCEQTRRCGFGLYKSLLGYVRDCAQNRPLAVTRLLIRNAPIVSLSIALPLLLSQIRSSDLPVVVMVTIQPWRADTSPRVRLRRASDAVFETRSFAALRSTPPPEFADLSAILHLPKIATFSSASGHFADASSSRRPPADRYGVKRDRRKMTVSMLHLPPEDFSAGGGSVGGGARSGGGMPAKREQGTGSNKSAGCGSMAMSSPLDF